MLLKSSDKTALVWKENKISYNALLQKINAFSNLYNKETTSRIAIYAENRPEWIYSLYSGWYNDSVVVPIDFMSSPEEVTYILEDCKPEVFFCSNDKYKIVKEHLSKLSYEIKVIIFENIKDLKDNVHVENFPQKDKNATSLIIYTSGTTGSPKGVMLSYDNVYVNIEAVAVHIPIYTKDTTTLGFLPFHHIFPLLGTMTAPLFAGGILAISPSLTSEDLMETIQKNKVNNIIGVPRFYNLIRKGIMDKINKSLVAKLLFKIAEKVNSQNFSRKIFAKAHEKFGGEIAQLVCGGAAIDIEVARDFRTLGFSMLEGFGMTECAPMITFTRPGRRKLGSGGEALPGTVVEIRDGEVCAKGRNVMQGYYNRPEETAEILKDGWLYSGDLGKLDDEGFLFITGRKKEIIILSSGKNVNPVEIEFKLESLSDYISEVGVFNRQDQLQTVIFPNLAKLNEEQVHNIEEHFQTVIDRYNMNVSPYKKIVKFHLMNTELPKTRLGKIRRFMLEDLVTGEIKKDLDENFEESREYSLIKDFLIKTSEQMVHPNDHLEIDLGLDSLDKVNLLAFLQTTFGLDLDESIFVKYSTIENLSKYIEENKQKISLESINWSKILKEKLEIKLPKSWITHSWIKYILKASFKVYFRIKSEGLDNIPKEPCIITPNHQSYFDGLFLTSILKNFQLKRTLFYAKEKHMRKSWMKFLANKHNVIIMDINKDLKSSLQKMAAALSNGKNIIIFPEGTRTKDGSIGRFKKTFAILSRELNVPVVPVTIKGAFEALPTGGRFPKPWKKISVKFSEPVYPKDLNYDSIKDAVFTSVENRLKETAA
ncbi:MAG: AMP-binding protein [Melioribacteraceae bacterium]|nr:AMP-binding protein [Melioribacteraceae bacterium]